MRVLKRSIDARRSLQRADVAALAADDAPLHLVVGQVDNRYRGLRHMVSRALLNGERYDISRLLVGLVLGLALVLCGLADRALDIII